MLRTPTSKKPSWNSPKRLEVPQPRLRPGRMGQLNSLVVKRSVVIAGRKTSISLEDAFWNSLREIAHMRKETLSQLVASINANRKAANLSSVIRVFVLDFYRSQFEREVMISQAVRRFSSSVCS